MNTLALRSNLVTSQFSHRETLAFRFMVYRTRLFALGLADAMGMEEEQAGAYADRLADLYVETACDDDVVDQVLCDLHDIGVAEYRHVIEEQLKAAEAAAEEKFYQ